VESAIFLFTRRVLAFFRVYPAESFNQPDFCNPGRLFLSIVGSTSGKPGETGRGGGQKNKKNACFLFKGILQPTTKDFARPVQYGLAMDSQSPKKDESKVSSV